MVTLRSRELLFLKIDLFKLGLFYRCYSKCASAVKILLTAALPKNRCKTHTRLGGGTCQ